jgi:hypothetical protein
MIYRFLFIALLGDVGVLLFCSTLIAEHVIALGLLRYRSFVSEIPWWWDRAGLRLYIAIAAVGLGVAIYLVWPGLTSYLATGMISFEQMHWSRVIVAAFAGMSFLQVVIARLLLGLVDSVQARQIVMRGELETGGGTVAEDLRPRPGDAAAIR